MKQTQAEKIEARIQMLQRQLDMAEDAVARNGWLAELDSYARDTRLAQQARVERVATLKRQLEALRIAQDVLLTP